MNETVSAEEIEEQLSNRIFETGTKTKILLEVEEALQTYPKRPILLHLAALAALLENKPVKSARLQKRMRKSYEFLPSDYLLEAIGEAQQGRYLKAHRIMAKHKIQLPGDLYSITQFARPLRSWFERWNTKIGQQVKTAFQTKSTEKKVKQARVLPAKKKALGSGESLGREKEALKKDKVMLKPDSGIDSQDFTKPTAYIPMSFKLDTSKIFDKAYKLQPSSEEWFSLRNQFAHLSLLQGFDELLCLPTLKNVDTYWYQQETAKKVLKQFRGRVLLADEVGLGKTIEAGIILKEYILRGMASRVLILTPASLVGQWQEEMKVKFDIDFVTSYSSQLRKDPDAFWAQPRIIASIASARRKEQVERLKKQFFDVVIVDEAHHLKNRASSNWKCVDALQKRFLLLLSATPVQNSLIELYNLLTLLKPGIFKTEKEFKNQYMVHGKPRIPANQDKMRELMRDVMVRNTRSLVDVKLPQRHAKTLFLTPCEEEKESYKALSDCVSHDSLDGVGKRRLALHHLLMAAGSSPFAAKKAVERFINKNGENDKWLAVKRKYENCSGSIKIEMLIELLRKNPNEKKMIFVQNRDSLAYLLTVLQEQNILCEKFDGSMSGPAKDKAIEAFRDIAPVLLCTETGGEGRNVQFCNTLINFDLPWNPMAIEQRIGRIHRIGQTREVFIFNFAVKNTLEEQVLRVLDEKINMFELVVGEINVILGEMDETQDFADMVFQLWVNSKDEQRTEQFDELASKLDKAKIKYQSVKELDDKLFGDDFETA